MDNFLQKDTRKTDVVDREGTKKALESLGFFDLAYQKITFQARNPLKTIT